MPDVISVLGMHRNGTSSVAGTLTKIGGAPPKHLTKNDAHNQRGYFESYVIVPLSDEILASAGTRWDDWREFNPEWHLGSHIEGFRRRAREAFELEYQDASLPVMKDPRICRFFPFWRKVYDDLGFCSRVVIPVRSPLDTAKSLNSRDGMPLAKGILLWLRHVLDAEADSRDLPRSIFTWEEFLTDWRATCSKISSEIGIVWAGLSDRSEAEVDQFLSSTLRHHASDEEAQDKLRLLNPWAFKAYEALKELSRSPSSPEAQSTLSEAREALNFSSRIFGKVLIGHELAIEESAKRLSQLDQALSACKEDAQSNALKADSLEGALVVSKQRQLDMEAELVGLRHKINDFSDIVDSAQLSILELTEQRDGALQSQSVLETELRETVHESRIRATRLEERDHTIFSLREQARSQQEKYVGSCAELARTLKRRRRARFGAHLRESVQDNRTAEELALTGLFDALYYRAQCKDVPNAANWTDKEAALHFVCEGFARGFKPNAYFDTIWYLAQNHDVLLAGVNPLLHYHTAGWREGRDPSPNFCTSFYLHTNADIRQARINPLQHFIAYGLQEGRLARNEVG